MHRFYLPPTECHGNTLTLNGAEAHHALDVVRVRPGERVVVLEGAGCEYLCQVSGTDRHAVRLELMQRSANPKPESEVVLVQAVAKQKSMEMIVQKATELGAARIIPVLSERSVPQVEGEAAEKKGEKWLAIAIEAMKQCGCPWLPQLEAPLGVSEFLARGEGFELALLASLQPGSRHPRDYFRTFQSEHKRTPRRVGVWVGPEGDFTPAELNTIKAAGALPITLGPMVLRSETAAMYCLAVLSYELQAAKAGAA